MAFRKYQSVQTFDPLKGDLKVAAQKVSSSRSKLDNEVLTEEERRIAEAQHRQASAKLAS